MSLGVNRIRDIELSAIAIEALQAQKTVSFLWGRAEGIHSGWLAGQMGHEDVEMVFKVYGKWIDANYQKVRVQSDRCELPHHQALKRANISIGPI
ncbi:hypothetical protein [Allopusillimonas ginsengisoli]|uniref:hypothetical protein n=1 Tax=Allopusillimonas ginsengisoli TaxID=453575 RepID=UPI0010213705|nr:hypothetical protein [Allopusillimonas ginsengisoli]TEA74218.1 hypothetical protein ERE07_18190 [Allopusillimonas ginsengisoli]